MQRSRIGILGAAAAMLSAIGSQGLVRGGIRRVTSDSKAGRQMVSVHLKRSRRKYTPHIGAKEQERAKRLSKSMFLNERLGINPRVSPTLCQHAKV